MVNFGEIERTVCFGSGKVLVRAVEIAKKRGLETAVVTAPRQKDTQIEGQPLVDHLDTMDVPYIVTENVNGNSGVGKLVDEKTLGLSFGAAWIFEESFIQRFNGGLVNLHGSRLPQNRGGAIFSWNILRDEPLGYSQIHLIEPSLDSGDILLTDEYRFPPSCRTPLDHKIHSRKKDINLVERFFDRVLAGDSFDVQAQPEYLSSYWPRLSTEHHGYLNWDWSLEDIALFIRAFSDPYEGAKTFVKGIDVRLKECATTQFDGTFHPFQTGIIYRKHEGRCYVATSEGTLIIGSVLNEDNEEINRELSLGARFYTPTDILENAKQSRVYFTPSGMRREKF